jgi:Zn finger protein HypA/HybF involved in hydrogenase expression
MSRIEDQVAGKKCIKCGDVFPITALQASHPWENVCEKCLDKRIKVKEGE